MRSLFSEVAIDGDRLWRSLMDMAQIGATAAGGVCRLALTDEDARARELFTTWCEQAGCAVRRDAIGNLFARRRGREERAPPILIGSHLDSQPTGGKFDGVYGVLAGLEVIRTLNERGIETHAPLEVVSWTNEEGARFSPAMLGSAVFSQTLSLQDALASTDVHGCTIAQALERIGYTYSTHTPSHAPAYYLELHIEQGPVLEREQVEIGVVTGVQGIRWYDVTVTGAETHAGPTPMSMRRDPVQASLPLLSTLFDLARRFAPDARVTVGQLQAMPGSRNTVPGQVRFSLDVRHPDAQVLNRMQDEIAASIDAAQGSCRVTMEPVWFSSPVMFATQCTSAVRAAATRSGYSQRDIVSGAGHDAVNLSRIVPAGMIFVPCRQGVSHNEQESIEPQHATAGANVLLQAALQLDADLELPSGQLPTDHDL